MPIGSLWWMPISVLLAVGILYAALLRVRRRPPLLLTALGGFLHDQSLAQVARVAVTPPLESGFELSVPGMHVSYRYSGMYEGTESFNVHCKGKKGFSLGLRGGRISSFKRHGMPLIGEPAFEKEDVDALLEFCARARQLAKERA